ARDHTGRSQLIAVPNLGRRNHLRVKGLPRDDSVRIYAYEFTLDPARHLRRTLLLESMRDMHSLAVVPGRPGEAERLLFVGIEGVELMGGSPTQPWQSTGARLYPGMTAPNRRPDQSLHAGLGEIDLGRTAERAFLATVEPKHGHQVVVYRANAAG